MSDITSLSHLKFVVYIRWAPLLTPRHGAVLIANSLRLTAEQIPVMVPITIPFELLLIY